MDSLDDSFFVISSIAGGIIGVVILAISQEPKFRPWFRVPEKEPKELRNLHLEFLESQKSLEQYFLPHLWLDICSFIMDADRSLRSRHGSYEWLPEFSRPSEAGRYSRFTPETFSKSILKFNEAPDEFIRRLEEYNSDIRVRDVSEEMIKYAMAYDDTARSWIFLMEKIAKVLDEPKSSVKKAPDSLSARSKGLHRALEVSEDPVVTQGQTSTSAWMRTFIERSIAEDSVEESSSE